MPHLFLKLCTCEGLAKLGAFLRCPCNIIVFGGLCSGPSVYGNYHLHSNCLVQTQVGRCTMQSVDAEPYHHGVLDGWGCASQDSDDRARICVLRLDSCHVEVGGLA